MPVPVLNTIKSLYMREPDRDPGRLQDIIEAANYVTSFIEGLNYEQFLNDKLRYFAVLKNVEIIGEASYMISPVMKDAHPEIPWKQITKMRHILVHGYSSVLPEILWETATTDIPLLREQVKGLLEV